MDEMTEPTDKEPVTPAESDESDAENIAEADAGDQWRHPGVGKIPGARSGR